MPVVDLTGSALKAHRTSVVAPSDLAEFWATTLAEAEAASGEPEVVPVENGLSGLDTWDVTFGGFGGHPIKAWYHRPGGASGDLPVVVSFQGYGGGRGLAHEVRRWVLAGYASLEVDTRAQGGTWRLGDTADPVGSGPAQVGFLTQGVGDPRTLYYRRVFTDAARAAQVARSLPGADGRVVTDGDSQGGAQAIAAAALTEVTGAMPSVPFLCDLPRAVDVAAQGPYTELERYLAVHRDAAERVWAALAYVDCAVLAEHASCPAIFATGGRDLVCPPSTGYAAFNAWAGPKVMHHYPYNGHEGGEGHHERAKLAWLADLLV